MCLVPRCASRAVRTWKFGTFFLYVVISGSHFLCVWVLLEEYRALDSWGDDASTVTFGRMTHIQGVSFDWGCLYYNWGILSENPGQSNTPNRLKAEKWPKLQREAKKCVFMTQTAARSKKSARSITIVTQT